MSRQQLTAKSLCRFKEADAPGKGQGSRAKSTLRSSSMVNLSVVNSHNRNSARVKRSSLRDADDFFHLRDPLQSWHSLASVAAQSHSAGSTPILSRKLRRNTVSSPTLHPKPLSSRSASLKSLRGNERSLSQEHNLEAPREGLTSASLGDLRHQNDDSFHRCQSVRLTPQPPKVPRKRRLPKLPRKTSIESTSSQPSEEGGFETPADAVLRRCQAVDEARHVIWQNGVQSGELFPGLSRGALNRKSCDFLLQRSIERNSPRSSFDFLE